MVSMIPHVHLHDLQTGDDLRQFLTVFDPDLGKPLPERTYADECTIYTPGNPKGDFHNFLDKMDVFVACHFIGWWAKVCE
jgi:phosphatidylserine synthase 2